MGMITTITMAMGVLLSTVSGLVCYLGMGAAAGFLNLIPSGELVLFHPETSLVGGVLLIVLGILCQPNRSY